MKKIKVVSNWPKWRENRSEIIFGYFEILLFFLINQPHPPQEKNLVNDEKIKVAPSWLNWRENWLKIIFEFFVPTPSRILFDQQ